MKIGVVFQDSTAEAKVAQATKNSVVQAIKTLGYNYCEIPFTHNFVEDIKNNGVTLVFNAMHGKYGEDGYIQTILNALKIPYTHSGAFASKIGMNKILTNIYAQVCGIPIMQSFAILKSDLINGNYEITKKSFIKPVNGGSSVATFLLNVGEKLSNHQIEELKSYKDDDLFMIEEFFQGYEVAIGIVEDKIFGSCKIIPQEEYYTYHAKYNSNQTVYEVPALIEKNVYEKITQNALALHNVIGAKCISRVDFMVNQNEYRLIEINTHPGMTNTSLIPKMCKLNNMEYSDIVQILIKNSQFEVI